MIPLQLRKVSEIHPSEDLINRGMSHNNPEIKPQTDLWRRDDVVSVYESRTWTFNYYPRVSTFNLNHK